ncbi:MAG: saccharopine dehydrogenase C-terminal domain-containing protein [Patescibacteria group bacterium]
MKYDFVVLGADGMQGQIVVRDLLERGHTVFASDIYKSKIGEVIKKYGRNRAFFYFADLRDVNAATQAILMSGADTVINCADMYWNVNVYKACVETKTHCVDLGSWIELTQEQLAMDALFKKIKRTAITGCGSVPGIGNVMLRYAARKFDRLESVDVGFAWDSNQKKFVVPFSMKSILEEFTYNPRYIKDGKVAESKPLEISIEKNFRLIGPQKSFLVQHPELFTFFRYFKNQGLKNVRFFAGFPGHSLEKIYTLIELGFHSDKPVKIPELNGKIAPFDLLNPVFKRLKSPKGYTESENLWLEVSGLKNNKPQTMLMECLVPPVKGWEMHGCNIDTGFPAVIIAKMIKDGVIRECGSFAPEAIVPERPFFAELRKKGLEVYENGQLIS